LRTSREELIAALQRSAKKIILQRTDPAKAASEFSVFVQVVSEMAGDPMTAENIRKIREMRSKPRAPRAS
jgi:hypothetical protein